MKKRFRYFGSTLGATLAAGALAISPVALLPASAEEEEETEYTMEDQEDSGWFNRAVEAAGPAYGEADEFERDGYYLENEEDQGWFDRAVTAAGPGYTEADEFE